MQTVRDFILGGSKSYDQPRQLIKEQRHYFANKRPSSPSYAFSIMYGCELDRKEGWVPKNSCFQTSVLEKIPESPLDCKEIKPVSPKGNQPWIFTGRTDTEAEAPILCPPDGKSRLIGKDPDAGRDWGQEEKGTTEDEMAGWHHWLDGCESWTIKKAERQRIDAFELWYWRRLLRVPGTARRSN